MIRKDGTTEVAAFGRWSSTVGEFDADRRQRWRPTARGWPGTGLPLLRCCLLAVGRKKKEGTKERKNNNIWGLSVVGSSSDEHTPQHPRMELAAMTRPDC